MKTIEVSDETYEFLINLSKELNSQNHRGTRMPYIFQIEQVEEIPTSDGCGDEVWICDGHVCLRTDEDIKQAVFEYKEWDLDNEDHQNLFDDLDSYDIEQILEENYSKHSITTQKRYTNAFFTEKACVEHIKANDYHYSSPRDYLNHAFRNPEIEGVMKFLCELTGGKLHV